MDNQPKQLPNAYPNELEPYGHGSAPVTRYGSSVSGYSSPSYGGRPEPQEAPGNLFEYWRMLRRRKGTLILVAFLGAIVGLLISLPQTPVYRARASLEIQEMNQNFLNMKDASPVSDGVYAALADIQTQIKILESESLMDRVLNRVQKSRPATIRSGGTRLSAWRKALNLPGAAPSDPFSEALDQASMSFKVKSSGQTRIVELTAESTDPKVASDFVNALANEFIDQNIEARWKMSQHTADWLTRQMEEVRIKLERSEDALQTYARQSGLLFTSEKNSVSEDKLHQLQEELSKTQADRAAKQSRWENARSAPINSLSDVLNDTSLKDVEMKLADLRRQLAELSATYTEKHAKVKRVQAQIASLEGELANQRQTILGRIRSDFEEAQRHERLLAADYTAQARAVTDEGSKSIQYNILKREVDSNRQLYEAMLSRVKESSISAAMRASNIRIVDTAGTPQIPVRPKPALACVFGLFGGLFVGVIFVVARERADRTLQEPGDANFYLQMAELGVVPAAGGSARRTMYYSGRRLLPESKEASKGDAPKAAADRVELVTLQRRPSVIAESFRVVLTSLLFSSGNGHRPKVIVLTSAGPAEGKTTVASNLGIAIAEIKQRVLIVDGDLRRPRLHEIFDLPRNKGLRNLLETRPLSKDMVREAILETAIPNLYILPSGRATSGASNLLYSLSMPDLMQQLREQFDMILIDTPPMLQLPDARVFGRVSDGVILVIRAGKTVRDAALAARQRFDEDGTKMLGTVLNDWNPKTSKAGYYGNYKGYTYQAYAHYYVPKEESPSEGEVTQA